MFRFAWTVSNCANRSLTASFMLVFTLIFVFDIRFGCVVGLDFAVPGGLALVVSVVGSPIRMSASIGFTAIPHNLAFVVVERTTLHHCQH